jgi:hypothetical protein
MGLLLATGDLGFADLQDQVRLQGGFVCCLG